MFQVQPAPFGQAELVRGSRQQRGIRPPQGNSLNQVQLLEGLHRLGVVPGAEEWRPTEGRFDRPSA